MSALFKFIKRILISLMLLFVAYQILVIALLAMWKTQPVENSMFMLAHRIGGGSVTQEWVDYDQIAKPVKQAAIASEDAKFINHEGFDMEGIEAARQKNEVSGKASAGGSTITQQLAKNLFLTSHRSYVRKGEEALITVLLENMWDKQRILAVYLNVAEFGNGIYGIEAAAQHYFDKPAKKLNRDEAALLIAMLPNPKYYEEHQGAKRLRNKQRIIMRRMNSAALPAPPAE